MSNFLDVDPTILESNLRLTPDESEDDFNKLLGTNYKPVLPSPGFVLKTQEKSTGTKVFINVCQTSAVPPPREISEDELNELMQSDDPSDFRLPMSIGDVTQEPDKSGKPAKVIDFAVNPAFFTKLCGSDTFMNFFCTMVLQSLEQKHSLICVEELKQLKNRKVFGKLQMHRIRIDSKNKNLIQEKDQGDDKKKLIEIIDSDNKVEVPQYRMFKLKQGQNVLNIEVFLPAVRTIKEITLDVGEDRVLVESARNYLLDIHLPCLVRQDNCTATFDPTSKILTALLPVIGG